jgi:hypothetical protein
MLVSPPLMGGDKGEGGDIARTKAPGYGVGSFSRDNKVLTEREM